ncbi:MAG: hypothetical protein ACFFD2_12200 [Promethearchaeota archaeon]
MAGINVIDVDSSEIVKFSNKLEKIGKYDLPVVARQTLNELAFRMKGLSGRRGEIDKEAERQFEHIRNRTLFRAMTGVQKSSGNNINSMFSMAGIIERPGREKLAEGLAQQQEGGEIESGSTPISTARVGKNIAKRVKRSHYLNRLTPVDLRRNKGKRFIIRASTAFKNSRAIIFKSRSGIDFVARIKSMSRTGGRLFNFELLFRLNENSVTLEKKRPFVNDAARNLMRQGQRIFVEKAEKRIKRSFERR